MSSTCVDVEEVGKKTPRDRLMTDHNHVLLTLKFHDDWLQSTHDIHVRLHTTPAQHLVTIGSPVSSSHLSRRHTCLIITLVSSSCLIVTPVSSSCLIITPVSSSHVPHRHTFLTVRVSSFVSHHDCLNLPRQILPQSQTIQSFVTATTVVSSTHMTKQHLLSSRHATYHSLPQHLTMSSCRDATPWHCPYSLRSP